VSIAREYSTVSIARACVGRGPYTSEYSEYSTVSIARASARSAKVVLTDTTF
jgi:hypothetical protein